MKQTAGTPLWIGTEQPPKPNQWTAFRRSFRLAQKPARAIAQVAVDSKYWLWVNGTLVVFEGGLKRGPTPRDTYVDTVDLTPHLKEGTNTLAVLVWYFGKQGFSHKSSGKSGLYFSLDTGARPVQSDETWKALAHPAFGDTGEPHPNFRLPESNIRFDSQKDLGDWYAPLYDDRAWPSAMAFGPAPSAPWGRLVPRPTPLWKDSGRRGYPKVTVRGTIHIGTLPYNAQVTPYLKVSAPAGELVKIQTDNYLGGGPPSVRAEYVTRAGVQEFECYGWMSGHEIHYEVPPAVKVLALGYRETGFNTEFTGTFTCEDPFLNRLREKAVRTLYITMRDTYMDCPERERAQWWGDEVNELGEAFYALDTRGALLARKGIRELIAWQRPDGILYAPIPEGNWDQDLPLQMLASVGWYGFWTYYRYTGDRETLRMVYPGVKKYLDRWQLSADGVAVPYPGRWPWGDWGENIDMTLLYSAWLVLALKAQREMALLLGEDPGPIAARLQTLQSNFNRVFWTGKEYRSPDYKAATDDRAHALAVVAGLAEPAQYPAIKRVFETQEHASPYMEKYVLEALFRMGEVDLALQRLKKRYAKMVDHPYTTLWEGWGIGNDGFGGGTINHAWTGGPLTLMSEFIAGITPTEPGWKAFQIVPQLGPLQRVDASVTTPQGPLTVAIRSTPREVVFTIEAPPGTRGRIGLPGQSARAEVAAGHTHLVVRR